MRFVNVEELRDPLTISLGLSGGSGTGKTYSALRIARGMAKTKGGGRIGFVDTENRRALHYRDEFPEMAHLDLQAVDGSGAVAGYGPERWIEVIDAAEAASMPAVVVDSFSHGWEGVGGILDLHAEALNQLTGGDEGKADRFNMLAWAKVKPRWKRVVDRIVRSKTDLILCTRASAVPQKWDRQKGREVNAFKTKARRDDVPWNPKIDADLMFEMTAMIVLDPSRPGCPAYPIKVPDHLKAMFDPHRPMDEDVGRKLVEWSTGQASAAERKAVLDGARAAARGGKDALQAHYRALTPEQKAIVSSDIEAIKALAIEADERAAASDGNDLFGAEDRMPTEEELARAAEETRRFIEEQDRQIAGGAT